jgi:tRNA(Ile)-lysidine synthase TilS/MesJ
MPRHNTKFCIPHFREHILRQVKRSIRKYEMFGHSERVLLAVSGGKDSMALWKALLEHGYRVDGLHINNGFGSFSECSEEAVRAFAAREGVTAKIYGFEELAGYPFDTLLRHTHMPPCSLCGTAKRYLSNRAALEGGYDALATGHNLDDETAFLLGNLLHGQTGYLERQYPVLPAEPGLIRKTKPLVRLTDRDMRLYAQVEEIPYCGQECPHAKRVMSHFHKEVMNYVNDHSPGTKGSFYFGFVDKLQPALAEAADRRDDSRKELHYCESCGYKTTRKGKCLLCELRETVAREEDGGDA